MNKLNNKGYMLVEIILASVIAFGVAYSVINLTIKLKNKNDDLLVETQAVTDQSIITNKLMKYIQEEKENFDCDSVTINGNTIKYKNELVDIVSDYVNVGAITRNCNDNQVSITIPLSVKQLSNKNFDVRINYKITLTDVLIGNNMQAICKSSGFLGNSVELDNNIDFSKISSDTNGRGVYMVSSSKNDTHPICYYRGSVDNNNLIFANFCWKIVRTTETGGMKLIYNGTPTSGGKCTCTTGTCSQIGVNYFNSTVNTTVYGGSTIQGDGNMTIGHNATIDYWYKTNISDKGFGNYLENTIWCNDMTFSAYLRLYNKKAPSLDCPKETDKYTVNDQSTENGGGNGLLTYPVGLLTADEVSFAGAVFATADIRNTNYYLYTIQDWWTMSPVNTGGIPYVIYVHSVHSGSILTGGDSMRSTFGVRPSVSLKNGLRFSGFGTSDVPYVLSD